MGTQYYLVNVEKKAVLDIDKQRWLPEGVSRVQRGAVVTADMFDGIGFDEIERTNPSSFARFRHWLRRNGPAVVMSDAADDLPFEHDDINHPHWDLRDDWTGEHVFLQRTGESPSGWRTAPVQSELEKLVQGVKSP